MTFSIAFKKSTEKKDWNYIRIVHQDSQDGGSEGLGRGICDGGGEAELGAITVIVLTAATSEGGAHAQLTCDHQYY